jgi:xylan 1,4-beta-xylosidase
VYDAPGKMKIRSSARLATAAVALALAAVMALAGPRDSTDARQAAAAPPMQQASAAPSGAPAAPSSPVIIDVDAAHPGDEYHAAWNFFGADEPNYVYSPNGQKLLHELAALSPTPVHVRLHNLLTSGDGTPSLKWGSTNAYREDAAGNPVYDWTITDKIFDAMHNAGVEPLVEVGFMPEALSTNPEPYRHTFPKGPIFTGWSYPPKDYAKWGALVAAWATHLRDRYGADALHGWLWEVWNEPDISYWHGTPEEYDHLYDVTAAAIRSVLPDAKIGGPDATGPGARSTFLQQFLTHCSKGKNAATGGTGAPLDFISFHPKGSPTMVDGHVRMGLRNQLAAMDRGMKIVASFPEFRNTPIILGESDPEGCGACSLATNPVEAYRNGPLYGVYVADAEARTYELARKNGVNIEGSVTWALEFEGQPYFAGYRDLATNGVDKAVLNVFRMLGMLKGNWLPVTSSGGLAVEDMIANSVTGAPDINAIATRAAQEMDILVWNYHDDNVDAPAASVQIHVNGLAKKQHVTVEQFRMDENHSNAYRVWLGMGSPQTPTAEQQAALERAGALETFGSPQKMEAKGGILTVPFDLPRQGVELLRISLQ